MGAQQCPNCGLKSPAQTQACDCGWSFVNGAANPQRMYRPGKRSDHASGLVGAGVFVAGLVVVIASRGTAGSAGYGLGGSAMLVGLIWMVARAAKGTRGLR
jgi:hypothetical protein